MAYKAETNFVDVIPQAKQLKLSLNITFAEINDPSGSARTYLVWAGGVGALTKFPTRSAWFASP